MSAGQESKVWKRVECMAHARVGACGRVLDSCHRALHDVVACVPLALVHSERMCRPI